MQSMKADLHVHSKYSTRPAYWILQKLGCSESYVEPATLYRIARQKGMRFVTITDHNTIAGSLEIAHLPDAFISEEVTTYFPESGCKVHVLVLDITESQHADISRARGSIYDLVDYLNQQAITHVVAHPLFAVNDRLTPGLFEQILLLFKNFEVNGTRDEYQNKILLDVLRYLTPEHVERLACKHDLTPAGSAPWEKNLTGGSDDHSGFHIARTHTLVEQAGSLKDFLRAVDEGRTQVCGDACQPRILAHTLYSIAYQFYNRKFNLERLKKEDEFISFIDSALNAQGCIPQPFDSGQAGKPDIRWSKAGKKEGPAGTLSSFCEQAARKVLRDFPEFQRMAKGNDVSTQQRVTLCYRFVDQAADEILARLCDSAMEQLSSGNFFDVFQMIGAGGALYAMLAPYFIAYGVFTKDRQACRTVFERLYTGTGQDEPVRVAHFTDTLHDINGVAGTLKQQAEIAAQMDRHMTLITCGPQERRPGFETFAPIGTFDMPEYTDLKLYYPPLLKMTDFCYAQKFNRIHIATPGPVGLAALAIARILQLPVYGTYHTSLPQYVGQLTGDTGLEDLTWRYMVWFYNHVDLVFVPSRATGEELIERGISPEKIKFYKRGINTSFYHPGKRNGFFKRRFQMDDNTLKLLYVGRVSKEKNLDQLIRIMEIIVPAHPGVSLIVVGDGPYLQEMKSRCRDLPVNFTGFMDGEDLSQAYAGSDVFVFPSTTDTFGNVVLEAQASGVPVIVTDKGGPGENLISGRTGFVVPAGDIDAFVEKISLLINRPELLARMRREARMYMETRSFEAAFAEQWDLYLEPLPGCKGPSAARVN
ncbi:MAG: glycosyltransferase [Desulfosudaceae bacterium]